MYLDWQDRSEAFVIDIETDGFNPSVVWVMSWYDLKKNVLGRCVGHDQISSFFSVRAKDAVYVGHNILKFDGPVLARLLDVDISVKNCIDTLVISTLYSPSIENGHSLEAWGEKIGYPKIEFSDWSHYSEEMGVYCDRDVEITVKLFLRLMKTMQKINFSEKSIWLQHHLTIIIDRQRKNGFYFDGQRALAFYQQLRSLEHKLTDEIREVFPAERILVAKRPMWKKNGDDTEIYKKDKERYEVVPHNDGTYYAYEDVPFNIGSPNQRIAKLLELGWEPLEFTEKTKKGGGGNPKPFDKGKLSPSLERFVEANPMPEIALMAKWMSVNGRANMVNTWLENWNENDGCIHGKLHTADTLRFKHSAPNTANIPAVRSKTVDKGLSTEHDIVLLGESGYFTYEARDLWVARPGRVLVGTDAAGLELRMLAHYLARPDFTRQVVEGDPHQYNADVVGISRPQAKTLIYAIMYGAAAPKVAKTLGLSIPEGAKIRTMFLERLGLKELIEQCQHEQAHGRVELVDGSQVICPSPHAALNYKLQGGGARVMGLGCALLEIDIRKRGLDSLKVGDIHDEWQYDCDPLHADEHARQSVEAIREAGRRLCLTVPLNGEAKKGLTWAETH